MLGRNIGYKELENILNQLQAQLGIMHIVDLGQELYLVTFMSEEDQIFALME